MELTKVFNVEVERSAADQAILNDPNAPLQRKNEVVIAEMERSNIVIKEIEIAAYESGLSVEFCNYVNNADARGTSGILVQAPESFKATLESLKHVAKVSVETKPTTTDLPYI